MRNFKDYLSESLISTETKTRTQLLVQSVYSKYASHYSKNQPEVVGWMDGIRITSGMPRYTSGIPADGQTPHKQFDDGRKISELAGRRSSLKTLSKY